MCVCVSMGGGGGGVEGMNPDPIKVLPFGAESYITRQISTVSQVLLTFIVAYQFSIQTHFSHKYKKLKGSG